MDQRQSIKLYIFLLSLFFFLAMSDGFADDHRSAVTVEVENEFKQVVPVKEQASVRVLS